MTETSKTPDSQAPVTTLFCDVGGVLLTNGWDRNARSLAAETFQLDAEDMNERHHLTFDTYEEGELSLDEYLDRLVFFKPRSFTRETFRKFMFDQSKPYPEMIELVRRMKAEHGLKIVVVSNEGRELTEHRIRTFALDCFVDVFVSSSFVHFRKPDKKIFRLALDIGQAKPDEVVYIDDRSLFVEVASSIGIRGIVHKDLASTRQQLEAMTYSTSPCPI
ncbi:HAD family hydrolase [Oceanidesulfovibrio marinus]|uniref:HAD family phosphatase n=1 Tax=Oceanidesulfovibrio marinus TaxID=370038 RepID=A0A6P1ZF41_9BACT|nr:HAD family phosphatase [Oceanidesulfovibrio marinus]QJT08397.1 HAD family phosphatase [Oceanidesulfovibrio marinus]TVM33133.1 HAD family phosphatase [Oceanidesulfovibrio marinus]